MKAHPWLPLTPPLEFSLLSLPQFHGSLCNWLLPLYLALGLPHPLGLAIDKYMLTLSQCSYDAYQFFCSLCSAANN